MFHPCKIGRALYGVRLISYNAVLTPSWHRLVPGLASADDIIYRRRPPPVRYVTTQKKFLKNRPMPGRLSNSPVMCKSLKSYVVSFICDHSIICVPIFTMHTSVVVAQWFERSPCMLYAYCLWFFYCVVFYLTFRCYTHNCFLDFSYDCLYHCAQRWWIQANGYATCMLLPLYGFLVKTFFYPYSVVIFILIHADDNKNVNICLILSIISTCYLIYQ